MRRRGCVIQFSERLLKVCAVAEQFQEGAEGLLGSEVSQALGG